MALVDWGQGFGDEDRGGGFAADRLRWRDKRNGARVTFRRRCVTFANEYLVEVFQVVWWLFSRSFDVNLNHIAVFLSIRPARCFTIVILVRVAPTLFHNEIRQASSVHFAHWVVSSEDVKVYTSFLLNRISI